jgi:hypothetical protein
MAYISTEEVKEIRTEINKLFPKKDGWKISITRSHSSSVNVSIMESKLDLDPENKGDYGVNEYYINEHYNEFPVLLETFNKIKDAINGVKQYEDRNAGDMSADYGDSNFFYNIAVGKWDKNFVKVA